MNKWEIKQADFVVLRTPFLAEETISILSDKKLGDSVSRCKYLKFETSFS